MFATLVEIEDGLRALMHTLDPEVLHGSDAVVALERFSTIEKMANTGKTLMAKRVAETDAWKASGKASAEHFLASVAGCSLAEARRTLGTARKLGKLPETEKRARTGELSAGQTNDIASAAAADPSAEADLLDLARQASASELREQARKRRHAATENDRQRHARLKGARSLRQWIGDDGAANLFWNHLPEAGAEVSAILDDYIDDQFHAARRTGRREHRNAYAADAFIEALRDAAAFRRGETISDEDDDLDDRTTSEARSEAEDLDDADPVAANGPAEPRDLTDIGEPGEVGGPTDRDDPLDSVHLTPLHNAGVDDTAGPDVNRQGAGAPEADAAGRSGTVRSPSAGTSPGADRRTGTGPGSPDDDEMIGDPDHESSSRGRPSARRRARSRAGSRASRRRGADAKVIVRIDHTALVRGHTEAGETCEIAGIGAVPVTSVQALLDDAFIAAVITKGHDVTTVAHLGRQPNAHQQTALQAQGIECSTLGCPNRHHLERDHRIPWRVTHHTKLTELDWSCPHCHDRKTHHGDMLAPGTGKRRLLTKAEQVRWNRDHPDNPVDPPQTTYPNRPTTPDPPSPAPPRPPAARRRRSRAPADSLPFDA